MTDLQAYINLREGFRRRLLLFNESVRAYRKRGFPIHSPDEIRKTRKELTQAYNSLNQCITKNKPNDELYKNLKSQYYST